MKNFILLCLLGLLILGGCRQQQLTFDQNPENLQKITLISSVKGCAETDKGMAVTTKSLGSETEQAPKITITGNEINYLRAINHMCCRQAKIEKEINGANINIFEVWSGIGCKCQCFSTIEAKLNNLPAGSYQVNVYQKGTWGNGQIMEQELLLSEKINIR